MQQSRYTLGIEGDKKMLYIHKHISHKHTVLLNMGFPKTGSTSIHKFFQCGGLSSSHWKCGEELCGGCIRENVRKSLPPFQGCGSFQVWAQMDTENPPDMCYFPQVDAMNALYEAHPDATWLLPQRPIDDWLLSLQKWDEMDERIRQCDFDTRGRVDDFEMFAKEHFAAVRSFVLKHPTLTLIEFNISNPTPLFLAFPTIKQSCWGRSNIHASNNATNLELSKRLFQTFPRNIWIFWKQGDEIQNEAAVRCVQSWRTRNPTWNLTIVTDSNIHNFIAADDAELVRTIEKRQSSSDLARVALLERHGGIYADVDVYNLIPLDEWLPPYVEPTGTWIPSLKGRDRPVASWFIASFPDTELIRRWKRSIFAHARKYGKFEQYLQLHYDFDMLLQTDHLFRKHWEETPRIDATISESDECCTVVLPHEAQVQRVSIRHNGGFMVEMKKRTKEMIDSGAIPIIKGNDALVTETPTRSIMDFLDSLANNTTNA